MNTAGLSEHIVPLASLGLTTRILEAGAGPVVLLLHGNPDNADEWRNVMGRLAGRYRCIAPDFPGYGESPEPGRRFGYTLPELTHFVDAVLTAMKVETPVVLVVHDTGGMAGTAWADANVPRLRGIVVTNTVAFEGFRWFRIATTWGDGSLRGRLRARLGMAALGWRKGALFRRIFGRTSPQLSAAELDRFTASFALNPRAKRAALVQFRECVQPQFFAGFDAMWRRLTAAVPCRVVWGGDDPFIGPEYANRFGAQHVRLVPGIGHWVPIVAADDVAAAVTAIG